MADPRTLFGERRNQMTDSIRLTVESLQAYGPAHEHWALAWSGGKDSTALVTLVVWLIESGRVAAPKSLTVLYADTRLELQIDDGALVRLDVHDPARCWYVASWTPRREEVRRG